ncbi:MAG: transposase [Burkholderiaceae bacterium]|nr:transposase [Burkholderiaceae bacterium]
MTNDVLVGLDWAVHTHAVCIMDTAGWVLERFEVAHDRDGLADLMHPTGALGPTPAHRQWSDPRG